MREDKVTESKMDDIFQEMYHKLLKDGESILLSYFGGFSTNLVGNFADETEYIMKSKKEAKIITKRMFSVMVEGLQNICIHGDCLVSGKILGHVMLMEKDDRYWVSFGNFVSADKKKVLIHHLKKVNEMNNTQLKEYYLETLSKGALTEKNGAGLGVITIALKFKSKINYEFKQFGSDLFYYCMNVETQ